MVDIHTHVLPDLDDGAKNERESAELLRQEQEQGVHEIVFTPHYYGKKRPLKEFVAQRQAALEKIREYIPEGMRFRLGAEIHMTGVNDPCDDVLCALAIEGTKCVLFEFPFTEKWNKSLLQRVNEFINDTDYIPVIAHIERYKEVRKNPAIVAKLVHMGCLVQVNTRAFLDKRTKRFAFALLKNGLVHCLGTDTHSPLMRAPDYAAAREAVEAAGYAKEWKRAQLHMRKLFDNESIRITYKPVKKFLGLYF